MSRLRRLPATAGHAAISQRPHTNYELVDCEEKLVTAAELMVSELAELNAVVHGSSPIDLELLRADGIVKATVTDGGAGRPVPRVLVTQEPHGRGLPLVRSRQRPIGVWSSSRLENPCWCTLLWRGEPGSGQRSDSRGDLPGHLASSAEGSGLRAAGRRGPAVRIGRGRCFGCTWIGPPDVVPRGRLVEIQGTSPVTKGVRAETSEGSQVQKSGVAGACSALPASSQASPGDVERESELRFSAPASPLLGSLLAPSGPAPGGRGPLLSGLFASGGVALGDADLLL